MRHAAVGETAGSNGRGLFLQQVLDAGFLLHIIRLCRNITNACVDLFNLVCRNVVRSYAVGKKTQGLPVCCRFVFRFCYVMSMITDLVLQLS